MKSINKSGIWNKTLITLLILNGVQSLGFQMLTPHIPNYALRFGPSETMIGLLSSSFAIASVLMRPISGVLADRKNRKRTIILMQSCMALVSIGYAYAPNIPILLALRTIHGVFFAIGSTSVMTTGIKSLPERSLGQGISILGIAFILTQAAAPALGIYIETQWNYYTLFMFTACTYGIASIIAFSLGKQNVVENPRSEETKRKISFNNLFTADAIDLVLMTMAFTATLGLPALFMVIYGNEKEIGHIGLFFTILSAAIFFTRIFGGRVIDRISFKPMLLACASLAIIGIFLVGIAENFLTLAIAAAILGVGDGFIMPALQAGIVRRVGPEKVGVASASFMIGTDGSYAISPILFGVIAEYSNYSTAFLLLIVPMLAVLIFTLHMKRVTPV
jgi:MFS family permease